MAGIISYGAYVPRFRLGKETAGWGMPIEKAVANFDEDSITMAVAAGMDCVTGFDRDAINGLFFATTTSPYIEKQGAASVAAAVDLGRNIITNDITNVHILSVRIFTDDFHRTLIYVTLKECIVISKKLNMDTIFHILLR